MMIYQLLYVSTAVHPMSDEELNDLLEQSRKFNAENGLTGLLLYMEGTFAQVLEGDSQVVRALYYDKIAKDSRHYQCKVFLVRSVFEREFSEWSMGFRRLTAINIEEMPGFLDLENWGKVEAEPPQKPGSLRKMLLNLAEANQVI